MYDVVCPRQITPVNDIGVSVGVPSKVSRAVQGGTNATRGSKRKRSSTFREGARGDVKVVEMHAVVAGEYGVNDTAIWTKGKTRGLSGHGQRVVGIDDPSLAQVDKRDVNSLACGIS